MYFRLKADATEMSWMRHVASGFFRKKRTNNVASAFRRNRSDSEDAEHSHEPAHGANYSPALRCDSPGHQMSGFAMLFATLIGVFITPDGIVVGTDTAVSSRRGQSIREKYCVTGPRSVATLQGVYELTDTETQATVALYDHFRDFCAQIDRTQLP